MKSYNIHFIRHGDISETLKLLIKDAQPEEHIKSVALDHLKKDEKTGKEQNNEYKNDIIKNDVISNYDKKMLQDPFNKQYDRPSSYVIGNPKIFT